MLLRLLGPDGSECPLRGYENIVLLERRGDHVKGVNLGRAVEESCQGLQHLRIGIRVVSVGIVLVFPQTDCGHIYSARTGERDFVLETILSTKQIGRASCRERV